MFKSVPKSIVKKVREKYKKDYQIFSYEMPSWLAAV